MVVDQLVSLHNITEETLTWTRPNFFSFRYELVCSAGPLARLSVHGIGSKRYVLAETADESWRFDVFPLQRHIVPILLEGVGETIAVYKRGNPAEVVFQNGPVFRLRPQPPVKWTLDDSDGNLVFTTEQVEAFPLWRADLKLEPHALSLTQLPVLLSAACCGLVFD